MGRLDWWETDRISLDHAARDLLSLEAEEIEAGDFLNLLDAGEHQRVQRALADLAGTVRLDLLVKRNDGRS